MKKILIFLIAFFALLNISPKQVHANTTTFYEGEYAGKIYINKYDRQTRKTYFQRARFFRETTTNIEAYCIEPFKSFRGGSYYLNEYKYNNNIGQRIKLLAYFGYGYQNHTDSKWYAITQLMIWQTIVNNDDIYFTDGLNGKRINVYTDEINEINNLINNYHINPQFNMKNTVIKNKNFELIDTNNKLNNYEIITNKNIKIENNKIIGNLNQEEEIELTLKRINKRVYRTPLFFLNENSQDMFTPGDLENEHKVKIKVIEPEITIKKIDDKNESPLKGAKFQIINYENNEVLKEVETDEAGIINIKEIPLGKYKIKEIESPKGYMLNQEEKIVELTEEKSKELLVVKNKIIEKEIIINKSINDGEISEKEPGINFELYKENKLLGTYKTDEFGSINLKLEYGEYRLHQLNTTNGYKKADDVNISVLDNKKLNINIKDEIIKKSIIIKKLFGNKNNFKPEKNIKFNILKDNIVIKTIETNEFGIAEVELPYGKYTFQQLTSTKGYEMVEDFSINIEDEEKKEIILKDYKIEVPDTFKNKKELDLINLIILLIYAKIFNIYNFNYNNLFNHFI
jgi:LPXTG-motif cell wall anchor domain protein